MSEPSKEAITWHKFVPGRDGTCISCGLKQKECQAKAAQSHDAEVRKPMVEALKRAKGCIIIKAYLKAIEHIDAALADAALAQVKEGK